MFHRNNQGASISQKSSRGLLAGGGGVLQHPKYWGLFTPQQPFWGFNVRPQWQDIPHTLSRICNIRIRWLSHRTVGTGKSVQVLGLSPKRTGLGVPHGSSSVAAGAGDETGQAEKFGRLPGEVGEAHPEKLGLREGEWGRLGLKVTFKVKIWSWG